MIREIKSVGAVYDRAIYSKGFEACIGGESSKIKRAVIDRAYRYYSYKT